MNGLSSLFSLPLTWQLTALSLGAAVVLACGLSLLAAWLLRHRPAPVRYGLLLSAVVLCLAAPGLSQLGRLSGLGQVRITPPPEPAIPVVVAPAVLPQTILPVEMPQTVATPPPVPTKPHFVFSWALTGGILMAIWVLGILTGLARLALGAAMVWRLLRSSRPANSATLRTAAERACLALGLRAAPRLRESAMTPMPLVVGLFRPVILLPSGLAERLEAEQLDAVLLHETAHVAHRDPLVGFAQRLAGALFWWCPLLHLVNRRLNELREYICDNYVVRTQGDGFRLARVLVDLAEQAQSGRWLRLAGAMAVTEPGGTRLEARVRRLLRGDCNTVTRMNLAALCGTAVFSLLVGCTMMAGAVRTNEKSKIGPDDTPAVQVTKVSAAEYTIATTKNGARLTSTPGKWGKMTISSGDDLQWVFEAMVNPLDDKHVELSYRLSLAEKTSIREWQEHERRVPLGQWVKMTDEASPFTGVKEIRLSRGVPGSPQAETVSIKEPAKITELLATIKLEKKAPCACLHLESAVFVKDQGEIKVSLCDHCFNFGGKFCEMPTVFYALFQKAFPQTVYLRSPITEASVFADGTIERVWPDKIELLVPEREVPEPLRPVINAKTVITLDGKPARAADLRAGMAAHVVFADMGSETAKEIMAQSAAPPTRPAVKNGLSVIIKPSKTRFAPGEALAFDYTFTNVGEKLEYALYNKLFDYMYSDPPTFDAAASISIRNPATGESWQIRCEAEFLRKYREFPTVVLAPGKSYSGTFKFEDCLHFLPQGGKSVDRLPPGKYRLTVTWKFPAVTEPSKIMWWSGEITANPIEFEILAQAGGATGAVKPAEEELLLGSPITKVSVFADGTIARVWAERIELLLPVATALLPIINAKTLITIDGKPAQAADLRVGMTAHVVFDDQKPAAGSLSTDIAKEIAARSRPEVQERVRQLERDADHFVFELRYFGKQDKPYYNILVGGPQAQMPEKEDSLLTVRLTAEQVRGLVAHLAEDGFLADAKDIRFKKLKQPAGPCYVMTARAKDVELWQELPWNLSMLERLDALRSALSGEANSALNTLLGRMDGHRREWKKAGTAAILQSLANGAKGGQLPADFSVTISTKGYPTKESGVTNTFFEETWRFTPASVSRLNEHRQPAATVKFDGIQAVCRNLLNGHWAELDGAARGRETPILSLLGVPCRGGGEGIIVTADGNRLAVTGQNCWITSFADPKDQERFDRLYAGLRQLALEANPSGWGAAGEAQLAPERAKQATVVLRVRGTGGSTTEQYVGGKLTAKGTWVRILEVLKNKGPEKLAKDGGIEILWDPGDKGLPDDECTVYLEPYRGENWKEGLYSYRFIGANVLPQQARAGNNKQDISPATKDSATETAFAIRCPREGDAVAVSREEKRVVFTVTSPRGIGSATITRQGATWPAAMILRLKLSGLESLTVQAGNRTLKASALSHSDYARRVQLVQGENQTDTLECGLLRAFTADGKPTDKLPGQGGWFELTLPRELVTDDIRELKVGWIDFYR